LKSGLARKQRLTRFKAGGLFSPWIHHMTAWSEVSTWLLRGLALLVGFFLVYGAALLREDEDKRLENTLQKLWERLTSVSNDAVQRHLSFAKQLAQEANRIMDAAYGDNLISVKSVTTSLALSTVSAAILGALFFAPPLFDRLVGEDTVPIFTYSFALSALTMTAVLPALVRGGWRLRVVTSTVLLIAISIYIYQSGFATTATTLSGVIVVALIINLFVTGAVRSLLRRAARARSGVDFAWPLTVSVLLVYALVMLVVRLAPILLMAPTLAALFFTSVTAVAPLLLSLMSISVLLHRLLWPTLLRPLYSFRRHRILFEHRRFSLILGAALMWAALWPDHFRQSIERIDLLQQLIGGLI
jgi:hypothetical protein